MVASTVTPTPDESLVVKMKRCMEEYSCLLATRAAGLRDKAYSQLR